jgi:hypothetical protein
MMSRDRWFDLAGWAERTAQRWDGNRESGPLTRLFRGFLGSETATFGSLVVGPYASPARR